MAEFRSAALEGAPPPTVPMLTKLMAHFTKLNAWPRALLLFEALVPLGLAPDTTIANAALNAADRGALARQALDVLRTMDVAGVLRDASTYKSAAAALCKGERWADALRVRALLRCAMAARQRHSAVSSGRPGRLCRTWPLQ